MGSSRTDLLQNQWYQSTYRDELETANGRDDLDQYGVVPVRDGCFDESGKSSFESG